jgi:hypothetical protein
MIDGGVGACYLGRNICGSSVVLFVAIMLFCRLLLLISGSGYSICYWLMVTW